MSSAAVQIDPETAWREQILAELAAFFERETGHRLADPHHMPIEARVPDRRRPRAVSP